MNESLATIVPEIQGELVMSRDPVETIKDAERAARALTNQVFTKIKPPVINGKRYPQVEHWQTVASFYGVFPRITETHFVQYGEVQGFDAVAEAVVASTGNVISRAEASCMDDEPRWKGRPLHQVKAMAQTRAVSRVLRNIFSRIMVLAGCEATPAEEMDGQTQTDTVQHDHPPVPEPQRKVESTAPEPKWVSLLEPPDIIATAPVGQGQSTSAPPTQNTGYITEKQQKRLWAIAKQAGWQNDKIKDFLLRDYNLEHTADIPRDKYEEIVTSIESGGGK